MKNSPHRDRYGGFAELAHHELSGKDYRITVFPRPGSSVAVIAPHGGGIERRTSIVAREIAREDFNLYLFEGIKANHNFSTLHITSTRFDEPLCLSLISQCLHVVAIHGWASDDERVLIGGLDDRLKTRITRALQRVGIGVQGDGHAFRGMHPHNICNRGRSKQGVQLELPNPLRGGPLEAAFIDAVRSVLLALPP